MNEVVLPPDVEILPVMPAYDLRPIGSLVPYARNSRTHSAAQIAMIAASLSEFGWTNPILADADGIVAGHGRVLAAEVKYQRGEAIRFPNGAQIPLGYVPVIDCAGWAPAQRRAYVIADNQIALQAGWNEELLRIEIKDLQVDGFDLNLLGFGDGLTDIMADEVEEDRDPDEVPELPAAPHSKPGDVWICGPHRIICGDSTKEATWSALMGVERGDLVMTDPPFGVSYQAKGKKAIANDDLTGDRLRAFLAEVYTHLRTHLKPGATAYTFHADSEGLAFRQALADSGFKVSQVLTWVKDSLVLGRSRYQWRHEPVLVADVPGGKQRWWGGRKQTTVLEWEGEPFQKLEDGRWAISHGDELLIIDGAARVEAVPGTVVRHPKPKRSAQHPTMKPTGLLTRLMQNSARRGDLVLEPFSGSGSTLMASELLGMSCRASELDPAYVDVAVLRWQGYTGRGAVHAVTGEAFPVAPEDSLHIDGRATVLK